MTTPHILLSKIVAYTDRLLRTATWNDWPEAVNGLQMENNGRVGRIAAAVDASWTTLRMAIAAQADLLLVHHGLFWAPSHPWTAKRYRLIRTLVENNLAIYSSHLPLDAHPRYGNNIQLCRAMGLKPSRKFFYEKGQPIGVAIDTRMTRNELARRLQRAVGQKPMVIPFGPATCRKIGVVSGGAGDQVKLAASEGVDTFITGEGPHWSYAAAEELDVNLMYAGHYATETFGVKALAEHLSRQFKVPWIFLDNPTGM
jgi:dinuclear metal center YbgI/SA1388 family protein